MSAVKNMSERENQKNNPISTPNERWYGTLFSSWTGSILFHLLIFALAFWIIQSGRPKIGSVMGDRTAESVGIVFSDDAGGAASGSIGPEITR